MNQDIKQVGGVWLPKHEEHLVHWCKHPKNHRRDARDRIVYQGRKQDSVIPFITQFRTMVDVGAHCGLWSMQTGMRFQRLEAFEPVALHRECFGLNLEPATIREDGGPSEVKLHACALGALEGAARIRTTRSSSGDSFVDDVKFSPSTVPGGNQDLLSDEVPIKRLDAFELQDVDFMKLDCEGYELLALQGGEETLRRCRPCIIVEQKPGKAVAFGLPELGAVAYLQSLGAKLRAEISGDFILSWD